MAVFLFEVRVCMYEDCHMLGPFWHSCKFTVTRTVSVLRLYEAYKILI